MGTITADGKAAVHCYTCDEEVIDNNLSEHLSTIGISIDKQVKTEKTIAELELEMNINYTTLSRAVEQGAELELYFGEGYTGMINIGSSC